MRHKLRLAAFLLTTALTPLRAEAGPALPFLSGMLNAFGISAMAPALGTAAFGSWTAGITAGSWLATSVIGQMFLSLGLSAIAQKLQGKPKVQSPSERLVNFAQPVAAMESVFGTVRKGGPMALTTFRDKRRHYAVILAAHPIDAVVQWYLDARPVTVAANGEVETAPYYRQDGTPSLDSSAMSLRLHKGEPGQVADAQFVSGIPEWTEAHDMAGLAYVAAHAKRVKDSDFSEVYGSSPPTGPVIAPVIRGASTIYDPRNETTGWTDNAALVWAWLTTTRLGGTVDWSHVAAEADVCDQLIQDRNGNWVKRWTLSGVFDDATDYEDLRAQVIAACDGIMFERPDGSVGLTVGRWVEPDIVLTEDDFYRLSIVEDDWGVSPPTEFVAQYVEPAHDWLEAASAAWVADPTGPRVRSTPVLTLINHHNQAMRALKAIAAVSRPRYRVTAEIGAIGYKLVERRTVQIRAHGWDFPLEIGAIRRGDNIARLILEGTSTSEDRHSFNSALEEPPRPARQKTESEDSVAIPASISGTAVEGPAIRWSWPGQDETLSQELRVREIGGDWLPSVTVRDASEYLTPAVDGAQYEAEIRNITSARRPSGWRLSSPVTAVADAVAPAALAGFEVVATGSTAAISITPPNDPRYAATRIYRLDLPAADPGPYNLADADLVGTLYGITITATEASLPLGRLVWWAVPINGSGIEGPASGPEITDIV